MGKIDFLYFRGNELPEPLMAGDLYLDICENVHLHFRDLRIEFTCAEFQEFLNHISKIGDAFAVWSEGNSDWIEAPDPENFNNREVIWLGEYTPGSRLLRNSEASYWPRRVSLERVVNGTCHFHYRNLRLEFTEDSFEYIKQAFQQAEKSFLTHVREKQSSFHDSISAKQDEVPEFRGFIDGLSGSKLWGWVQAIEDPSVSWEVKLLIDGEEILQTLACGYRPDLANCFGYGNSGFEIESPLLLRKSRDEIRVVILPYDQDLSWGAGSTGSSARPFLYLENPSSLPIDAAFFNRFIKNRLVMGVDLKEVRLDELLIHVYGADGESYVQIKDSPAYRYLCGDVNYYRSYHRYENGYNRHSEEGFKQLIDSFEKDGYDQNNLIVTFNNEKIVRDGHHRAAILFHQKPEAKVWVLNLNL